MSRSVKALNGFAADIIGQVVTQLLTFVAIPVYLNYLSNISYGYWLTIGSIIMWISLSDLGIGMALGRLLIKIQTTESEEQIKNERYKLVNTAVTIFFICAIIFFLVGMILYPFCLKWFKIEQPVIHVFSVTYFICVLSGALSLPGSVFAGVLESNQRLALNRNLSTLGTIINIVISVTLVLLLKDITALAISLLLSVVIRTMISWYYANKTAALNLSVFVYDKSYGKQLLSSGGYFQIARVANTVATNSDNLFIASFMNAGIVPMYSFTIKMAQIFGITLASKIPYALFAGMAEIIDLKQDDKLRDIFKLLMKVLVRIAVLTAAYAYFFNENFVTLWIGKHNYAGYWVNLIVCYWILYEFIARGTAALVFAYGDFKGYAYISIIEICVNVMLSIILIQKYGLFGVAISTAISRTLTTGIFLFLYFKRKRLISLLLLKILFKVLLLSIPTFVFFIICKIFIVDINWFELVLIGFIGAIINSLCFDFMIVFRNRHLGIKQLFYKVLFNL